MKCYFVKFVNLFASRLWVLAGLGLDCARTLGGSANLSGGLP
jgi:hypothetical protein